MYNIRVQISMLSYNTTSYSKWKASNGLNVFCTERQEDDRNVQESIQ